LCLLKFKAKESDLSFQLKSLLSVKKKYVRIVLAGLFIACQPQSTKPPVAPDKFAPIYTDYIIAADLSENEDMAALLDSILASYQLPAKDFRDNLQYYADHPQEWEELLEAVIKQLNQRVHEFEAEALQEPLKPPPIQPKRAPAKPYF
jgi:hypothetical protein